MTNTLLHGIFSRLRSRGLPLGTRDYLEGLKAFKLYKNSFLSLYATLSESTVDKQESQAICIGRERLVIIWLCQTLWARNQHEKQLVHEVLTEEVDLPDNQLTYYFIKLLEQPHRKIPEELDFSEPAPTYPFEKNNEQEKISSTEKIDKDPVATANDQITTIAEKRFGVNILDQNEANENDKLNSKIPLPILPDTQIDGQYQMSEPPPVSELWLLSLWRRLLRPVKRIDPMRIDLDKTIQQAGKTGYLIEPVLAKTTVNTVNLVILIDVSEAMSPWRNVETLLTSSLSSKMSRLNHVSILYFNRTPGDNFFEKRTLHNPIDANVFFKKNQTASIIIFSEAGAATCTFSNSMQTRLESFINNAKTHCISPVVWINPLPISRWQPRFRKFLNQNRFIYPCEFKQESLWQAIEHIRLGKK